MSTEYSRADFGDSKKCCNQPSEEETNLVKRIIAKFRKPRKKYLTMKRDCGIIILIKAREVYNKMTISITNHARERMKKRTNYSPTRAEEVVEEAYYCGKDIEEFDGKVKIYLKNVLQRSKDEGRGDILKVLGNDIYLFGNNCLITIFPLSDKIRKNRRKTSKGDRIYYD